MLDVGRMLLDGAVLAVVVSAWLVAALWYNPRLFLNKGDFPPDIVAAAPPKTRAEKRLAAIVGVPFILVSLAFPLWSTIAFASRAGGDTGFAVLFAHALGVIAMPFFVDLVLLDWLLVCTITPDFVVVPGTEGFAGYKDYGFHLRMHARASVAMIAVALLIAVITGAL
jgi:uncharacterized membrane protein